MFGDIYVVKDSNTACFVEFQFFSKYEKQNQEQMIITAAKMAEPNREIQEIIKEVKSNGLFGD